MTTKDFDFFLIGGSAGLAAPIMQRFLKSANIHVISRKKRNFKNKKCKWIKVKSYNEKAISNIIKKNSSKKKIIIMFLNAISDTKPFYYITSKELNKIVNTNLILPLNITKEILVKLFNKEIKFIYFSSSRAEKGDKGITIYAASKTALINSIKSLSMEYSNLKKFFYGISLGIFKTGLIKKVPKNKIKKIKSESAISDFVKFDDLNNCIELIIKNNSLTGSVINCDNGYK